MGRIGATISGIERQLLNRLSEANSAAALNSVRLATGRKINSPKDNPAGFVLVSGLEAQRSRTLRSLNSVTVSSSLGADLQLSLDQIRVELDTIRTKALADEDQALTPDERAANQSAIDAAIERIGQIVGSESGGRRFLDGSADFTYSGINGSQIREIRARSLGRNASATISGAVTTAATQAQLTHAEGAATLASSATFTLAGDRGSVSVSVTAGETLTVARDRINQEAHRTGVVAEVSGTNLQLKSIEYGTAADVTLTVTSGSFATTGGTNGTARGIDAAAVLNDVSYTASGNRFALRDAGIDVEFEIVGGFSGPLDPVTIGGGAPSFSVSDDLRQRVTLALPSLNAARLGGLSGTLDELRTGGARSGLGTQASNAVRIVDEALGDLTRVEGHVDGFVNQILHSSSSLLSGLAAQSQLALDEIDQVDEEEEGLLLRKNELLAGNVLAALGILSDQRASIAELLRKAAGLS